MNCVNCSKPKDTHDYYGLCNTNPDEVHQAYCNGELEQSEVSLYRPEFPRYLNVYHVEQSFGGPEEGGWWFDVGEPLESVVVENEEEQKQVQAKLEARYVASPDDRKRMRGRTSAAGGYDISICVEYSFAQPFPQETPHYE